MNIENEFIDDQTIKLISDWYEIFGVNKIAELSRQLRSLLNFKNHIIILRFGSYESSKESILSHPKHFKLKSEFEKTSLRFVKFLNQNLKVNLSVENSLQIIRDKAISFRDKYSLSVIENLKKLLNDLFKILHLISEQEIKWDYKFLKLVFSVTKEACRVNQFIDFRYALFYKELRDFYLHLEHDLSSVFINEMSPIKQNVEPLTI